MSKARLSHATTWIKEEKDGKEKEDGKPKIVKLEGLQKKKQIVCLRKETVKRLWRHRAETGKTISDTLDELVVSYIPEY